jgi:hypothetical protein
MAIFVMTEKCATKKYGGQVNATRKLLTLVAILRAAVFIAGPMPIQWGIAERYPEKAAHLIREYKFQSNQGSRLGALHCLPKVSFHMAHSDWKLAMDLADLREKAAPEFSSLDDEAGAANPDTAEILLKALIYGFIAEAIVDSQPEDAKFVLQQALTLLKPIRTAVRNRGNFLHTPALIAATFVPTAAKIDNALATEVCWRAMSLRLPERIVRSSRG